jgi:threonine/homoserine/homoserine lactone efflux protein
LILNFNTEIVYALTAFCTVTLFTPGPNNIMLMASGLNFGFRRTIPHMIGVPLGFAFMVISVGLGLGAVFHTWPAIFPILKYAGALYLIYLAWNIANSGSVDTPDEIKGKPLTFLQAASFQWINPKAWIMTLGAISAYGEVSVFPYNVLLTSSLYGVLGFVSSGVWVAFGYTLKQFIKNPTTVRLFNGAMALLLVATLYPIFVEDCC